MRRLEHWRGEFEAEIDRIKSNPFRWGAEDCMYGLITPVIKAITGKRLFDKYRGRYKTAKGALGVMRRAGFKTLADLVASELPEVHPSRCRVGDVVALPTDDEFGFSLGIVNGDRVFVVHEFGLGTRDLMEATRAFKVG